MIDDFSLVFEKESNLRYGENPHQKAVYEIKTLNLLVLIILKFLAKNYRIIIS